MNLSLISLSILIPLLVGNLLRNTNILQLRYICPNIEDLPEKCNDQEYFPSCGLYDNSTVRCDSKVCMSEYSSPCIACKDPKIIYVSCGKCPTVKSTDTITYFDIRKVPVCQYDLLNKQPNK